MDSKKPLYKSITFWIMVLFLLYSALGFFAVPYFAKDQLKEFFLKQLNSTVKIEKISFNPFFISIKISDITLTDKDSTQWFTANKIVVNANLWNSVFKNTSISKLEVTNPYYKIVTQKLNGLSTLKYPQLTTSPTETGDTALLLDIEEVSIKNGSIKYNDNTGKKHLSLNLKEIVFINQKFTTKDQDTEFNLSFVTDKNETTNLSGKFNFLKQSIDVKWKLENWTTATLFDFISDNNNQLLGFKNQTGTMQAQGNILHSGANDSLPYIAIEKLTLNKFTTLENPDIQPHISLPTLTINNAQIDLNKESINIEALASANAEVAINFTDDYALISKIDQTLTTEKTSKNNNWQYTIQTINANNAQLRLNKKTENTLTLKQIKISNLTNSKKQKSDIDLSIAMDEVGIFELKGDLMLEPLNLSADITMQNTDVSKWDNWMPENVNLTTETGFLTLQQHITYKNSNVFTKGSIKLNNLKLLDSDEKEFLTVNQLDFLDSSIDTSKKSIILNTVKIDQAHGTLSVSSDKQLNLKSLTNQNQDSKDNNKQEDWIIEIKEVELIDSQTSFNDKSIKPNYHTELSKINGKVKGLSSTNLSKTDIEMKAVLDTYGEIDISGQINPLSEKAYTDLSINIKNLSLQNFNSYSARYLGFPITRGKADFELNYKLNQSMLKGLNNLKFKQLKFGKKNQSKEALNLPLKLAVTLLTDGKGIMKINLPVSGNIDDPDFSYGGLVFKAFFKLITGVVASPFKLLGKLVPGGADLDLSGIQFKEGSIELKEGEIDKLSIIKKILKKHPNMILELTSIVNTSSDKKVLQELNTTQDVNDSLNQLAKQRILSIQQQFIENFSVSADKIFIKPMQKSEELYPQVTFGIGN